MLYKPIIKIICLLIIIGLNWAGLSVVINTFAYFSDTETSSDNIFQAGTLDFSLYSPNNFFPTSPGESNQLFRDISVIKEGSLDFEYRMRTSDVISSGPGDLCNKLLLAADLSGGDIECPAMDLKSFNCGPFGISDSMDEWQFTASLPDGFSPGFIPKSCEFKLVFEVWQTNLTPSSGFSDVEEIENKVTKHFSDLLPRSDIVINEFLPNPIGEDDASAPNGEWVELYNRGNSTTTLTGWYLSDLNNNKLPIPTSSISPKGFLVIYLDGAFSPEWLDNKGDVVLLWAPKGEIQSLLYFKGYYCLIDVHFFTGAQVIEGKSFARIPDGSEIWYDPIPTPGEENQLSEEEVIADLQPEVIELDQEQLFQMFIEQLSEEPIFDEVEEPVVEEVLTAKEEPVSEGESVIEEESPAEEVTSVPSIEEGATGQATEENQEQGGIIEEINEIIDEVIEEIVDEIIPEEEPGDESVSEPEIPVIEDIPIIEEAPADETPAVEEQAVIAPSNDSVEPPAGE